VKIIKALIFINFHNNKLCAKIRNKGNVPATKITNKTVRKNKEEKSEFCIAEFVPCISGRAFFLRKNKEDYDG